MPKNSGEQRNLQFWWWPKTWFAGGGKKFYPPPNSPKIFLFFFANPDWGGNSYWGTFCYEAGFFSKKIYSLLAIGLYFFFALKAKNKGNIRNFWKFFPGRGFGFSFFFFFSYWSQKPKGRLGPPKKKNPTRGGTRPPNFLGATGTEKRMGWKKVPVLGKKKPGFLIFVKVGPEKGKELAGRKKKKTGFWIGRAEVF